MFIFASSSWSDSIAICLSGFLERRGFGLASTYQSHSWTCVGAAALWGETARREKMKRSVFFFFCLYSTACSAPSLSLSSAHTRSCLTFQTLSSPAAKETFRYKRPRCVNLSFGRLIHAATFAGLDECWQWDGVRMASPRRCQCPSQTSAVELKL